MGSVRNAGACPWNSTSASSGGLAPGALATPTADLPPGAPPGPFTAPSTAAVTLRAHPSFSGQSQGFLWRPLQGLQVAVGFMFHCECSQQGAVGGRAGGGLGEGGRSPPSGALAGCELREVSGAPLISPPSSREHPHQSVASSASRAGFACLCDCPEPALAECSAASGLPRQNCGPCSPAGLSGRLSNGQ